MRSLFLFLILGLCGCREVSRTPQSISSPQMGSYELVTGFDNCPEKLFIASSCGGFTVKVTQSQGSEDEQRFCDVNRGTKKEKMPTSVGTKIRHTTTIQTDTTFHRRQSITMKHNSQSLTLQKEDTLLFDDTGKLQWESRQENGQGLSCLYQASMK